MELKNEVIPELYSAMKYHYEAESYSNAIIDAIKALTAIIRSKSKLDDDGVSLVGQAFGGGAPPIKISPMRTISEVDEQKGFEQILRGLYLGIRNPRTHENYKDIKEESNAIIIFINYCYRRINDSDSRSFFQLDEFKKRIFDPLFVEKSEYAELLVREIPYDELVNTTNSILNDRENGDPKKLKCFFDAVFNKADAEQQQMIVKTFSNGLRTAQTDSEIIGLIRYMQPNLWPHIDDDAKLRIENKIISSVKEGYLENKTLIKGHLGSWGKSLGQYFKLKTDLARALIERLFPNWYTQNYVAKYYLLSLDSIVEGDYLIGECCKGLAYATLGNNAKLLKSELSGHFIFLPKKWRKLFLENGLRYRDGDQQYYDKLHEMIDEDVPF